MPEELAQVTASMEAKKQSVSEGHEIYQGTIGDLSVVATVPEGGGSRKLRIHIIVTIKFL